MAALLETFASFIPGVILRHLEANSAPISEPVSYGFPGAVLFADISGFTHLAERFAERGPVGVEDLSRLLNSYFGQLINLIGAHGGDVVKFAGDGLLALWPAIDEPLEVMTLRAAQCGLEIQAALHNYEATGVRLAMRVGIGVGELSVVHLGGVYQRWEPLVVGEPLVQVSRAEQRALPGEVLLSHEAWELVRLRCIGTPLVALPERNGKASSGEEVRLESVRLQIPLHAATPLARLSRVEESSIRAYIPGAILYRLLAGQSGWLAELRRLTILFVNLPTLSYETPLAQAQEVIRALQSALYRYEGSINKLSVDDKGVTLVAALGLPPFSHEDDAVRGVQAALSMQAALTELGWEGAIGLATGAAFCGSVGNETRREYTMVGDVVNLAARLMQAALLLQETTSLPILCDGATMQATQARVAFDALPPIFVKGKAESVPIYRPTGVLSQEESSESTPTVTMEIIGRAAERALLMEEVQALLRGGAGGVLVIEGEAGIGKSRLVADLLQRSASLGISKLVGAGDAIEKSTPYHAWRSVFRQLFGLAELTDDIEARRARVLSALQGDPALLRLAPLLNAVLPLDLPENELTLQLEGKVRADNTHDLLIRLLEQATQRAPLLLILEDTHWLDSASWALTLHLRQRVRPLLLMLATRPLTQPPLEYSQLLRAPDTHHMVLDMLLPEESLALVRQRLGVNELPEPVADLIREKAEGHPFFSEELAYALRDAGFIRVEGRQCLLTVPPERFRKNFFPDTVQGVITSRIDRLPPQQQLTLKVASVIGRVFSYRILHDIYPVEQDQPLLAEYLEALKHLDITPLEVPGPEPVYLFKHLITQEVVYNLMLFSQRRELHERAAAWYEQHHAEDLSPFYALLAYHWAKAENSPKTLFYLEKAGEQALHRGAYHEAVSALLAARQEIETEGVEISKERRGRLTLLLGEAHIGLGQVTESAQALTEAAALLGWPMPTSSTRLALALVQEIGKQMVARLRPLDIDQMTLGNSSSARLEAARAYQQLAEVYYYANAPTAMIYAVLRTVNLAEGQGLSPALAQAYATICVTTGIIPLHGLARAYGRWSRQIAERLGDLPTHMHVLARTSAYLIGVGEWEAAKQQSQQAIALAEHLGDHLRQAESLAIPAMVARFEGAFEEGVRLWEEIYTIARANDNRLHESWACVGKAQNLFRLGESERALALIEEAEALLAQNADSSSELLAAGMRALLHLRRGEEAIALQAAERCAHLLAQSPPVFFTALESYAAVARVFLTLWERGNPRLSPQAWAACKALQQYTRVFPIGQPSLLLHQGWLEWLGGQPGRARNAWQQSLSAAERLAMPYDVALAHYELARHLPPDDPARQTHLARARELFAALGAAHDLEVAL